jgi:fumarylacetoacetate (FAA) hydrolase
MEARLGPAKGKDSASSLGPWIATTDELAPFIRDGRLHPGCSLKVNGVKWMDNDAGLMYHTWGAMIERASRDSRIVPGDVIGSGTVTDGSIGEAIRNGFPARYLEPGDVVEIAVERIGILRNTTAPKINPDPNYRFKAPPPK